MKCIKCGCEMGTSNFCPECGAKREIAAANIFAQDNVPAPAPEQPVYQPIEEEEPKKPGFIRRNLGAIIAIIAVLLIAGGVIAFFILRDKDKKDKEIDPDAIAAWHEYHDQLAADREQEKADKEEEQANAFSFDSDFDWSDLDDMDDFIAAITGGQIPNVSQYITPEMEQALEDYAEIFAMLSDPNGVDMSDLQQYIDQIEQITYDLSGFDINGLSQDDFDSYEEVMEEFEALFGDDVDFSWSSDDFDISFDVDDEDDDDDSAGVTITTEVYTSEDEEG